MAACPPCRRGAKGHPQGRHAAAGEEAVTGEWQPAVWDELIDREEAAIHSAERISTEEARWLADRLERYRELRDHEVALIEFLAEESTDIDPALQPLMDKVRVGG